jgi:hypothetical protein
VTRSCRKLPMLVAASVVPIAYTFAADTSLIEPNSLIVDHSLPRAQVEAQVIAARRYDTFWNTGGEALAHAALAPNFIDNTLPTGRPQGLAGPLDLTAEVRDRATHLLRGRLMGTNRGERTIDPQLISI